MPGSPDQSLLVIEALRKACDINPCDNFRRILVPAAGVTNTYTQFRNRVLNVAARLKELHRQGDRLALLADTSDVYLLYYFAAAEAGLVLVPINTRWTEAELRRTLLHSGAKTLAFDDRHIDVVNSVSLKLNDRIRLIHIPESRLEVTSIRSTISHFALERPIVTNDNVSREEQLKNAVDDLVRSPELVQPCEGHSAPRTPSATDACFLFYTSGTTSDPKAVILSHQSLMVQARAKLSYVGYSQRTVYLHLVPLFHVGGASSALAVTLACGMHIIRSRFDPEAALFDVVAYGVNTLVVVPMMLRAFVDVASRCPAEKRYDGVKMILCGGGGLHEGLENEVRRVFRHARVVSTYGMTEAASSMCFRHHADGLRTSPLNGRMPGYLCPAHVKIAIGVEYDGVVQIVTSGNVTGEILTRGPHVMSGYWRDLVASEKAFIDSSHGSERKWFRTGDVGYLHPNGELHFLGRIKDMIKSGGENVYAAEVENVLCYHRDILEASVFGVDHRYLGEAVVGAVVLMKASEQYLRDTRPILTWCRRRLSSYKVPRRLWVINKMPRSDIGKIDKNKLRRVLHDEILEFGSDLHSAQPEISKRRARM